jgi:hypothetical protein
MMQTCRDKSRKKFSITATGQTHLIFDKFDDANRVFERRGLGG